MDDTTILTLNYRDAAPQEANFVTFFLHVHPFMFEQHLNIAVHEPVLFFEYSVL